MQKYSRVLAKRTPNGVTKSQPWLKKKNGNWVCGYQLTSYISMCLNTNVSQRGTIKKNYPTTIIIWLGIHFFEAKEFRDHFELIDSWFITVLVNNLSARFVVELIMWRKGPAQALQKKKEWWRGTKKRAITPSTQPKTIQRRLKGVCGHFEQAESWH